MQTMNRQNFVQFSFERIEKTTTEILHITNQNVPDGMSFREAAEVNRQVNLTLARLARLHKTMENILDTAHSDALSMSRY